MKNIFQLLLTGFVVLTIANCGGGGGSISTGSTSDSFDDGNLDFNPKMDILFVVDPSKSMFEEVEKVRNNISTFIEGFIGLGYQYRMGVISSSAWSALAFDADSNLTFLADANGPVFGRLHRGECVDRTNLQLEFLDFLNTNNVPDFLDRFSKNFDVYGIQASTTTSGCGLVGPPFASPAYPSITNNFFEDSNGYNTTTRQQVWEYINDERPLQSVQAFLERDALKAEGDRFVREDAHLAIIIVSDEPDSSRDSLTPSLNFVPGAAGNHTAQQYIDFLTTYKDNPATTINDGLANFSIYSIVDPSQTVNIAQEIASLSGGLSFDINASQSEYVSNLNQISQAILVSSAFFPIAYRPIISSIEIQIIRANGVIQNVPSSGFVYNPTLQGVTLNVEFLPGIGDGLKINYVPAQLISGVSEVPRLSLSNTAIAERPFFAPASPDPIADPTGYAADVYTKNGSVLGTASTLFADSTGGTFRIISATPTGAYSIDGVTGQITVADESLFDTEESSKHIIEIGLTLADLSEFEPRSFIINVLDVADSTPVAVADSYVVSETIAENNVLTFFGNLTFNDRGDFNLGQGIDGSEPHQWLVVANVTAQAPAVSTAGNPLLSINPNGTFTLTIQDVDSLNLQSGQSVNYQFSYRIRGTQRIGTANPFEEFSNTVTVAVSVEGFNQAPVLFNPIADVEVNFSGGLIKIPLVDTDVTTSSGVFATGTAANLVDGSFTSSATTNPAANGAHWVQIDFPNTSPLWEVDRFELDGAQSLGNAIVQVRAPGSTQVITREVLPVTAGNDLVVNMTQKVVGGSIRIIRPSGSRNSANDIDLQLNEIEVFGIEVEATVIDLTQHFSDPDNDPLRFLVTDQFGEGPAPGWAQIVGNTLVLTPPQGADTDIGILAIEDIGPNGGLTAFTVVNVTRVGAGQGALNGPPIAFLQLDDESRGGITMKRYGSGSGNNDPLLDNQIRHGEIDNFIVNPLHGQIIRNALVNYGGAIRNLAPSTYRNINNIPQALRDLLPPEQLPHFGDNYGSANGWSITPVHTDLKYPTQISYDYCTGDGSANGPSLISRPGGRIFPCINTLRSYGETYTGFFVPAETGVYRFKTRQIDDTVQMLMAPTEYSEDLIPVFVGNFNSGGYRNGCSGNNMICMIHSLVPGIQSGTNSEFVTPGGGPNGIGIGNPTQIFYDGSTQSYKNGYVLLKQGNVYALELRFGEGGGVVAFEFEYDRKDQDCDPVNNSPTSSCWDGFRGMDASVLVPREGTDAYDPQLIAAPGGSVGLDVKTLFYDAEQDILDYTARLVNPDGTQFLSGNIAEIGLTLNAQNGLLTGTLNAAFNTSNPQPRIIFTATERFTAAQAATSSLPIKFDPN